MNKKQLYEKIMRNVAREVKRALNENFGDNIEYDMFYGALGDFGELTLDDIHAIFNDDLYDTNGRKIVSMYIDGNKMYYTFDTPRGTLATELYMRDLTQDQQQRIYSYLQNNSDVNNEIKDIFN